MNANTPVRVLVVDDQKVVRDGLAMMLGLLDGIEVVGVAVDGADALRQVDDIDPDVVLMDLSMPTMDGVEATRQLAARGARARVVVLTTYADDQWVFGALQAGARGFLTKDAGADEIRTAVLSVAAGEAQLDPSVQRRLLEALASGAHVGIEPPHRRRSTTDSRPGARRAHRDRARAEQHRDRATALRLGGYGQDPRQPPARQNRLP